MTNTNTNTNNNDNFVSKELVTKIIAGLFALILAILSWFMIELYSQMSYNIIDVHKKVDKVEINLDYEIRERIRINEMISNKVDNCVTKQEFNSLANDIKETNKNVLTLIKESKK